jgi:hypothetical protein
LVSKVNSKVIATLWVATQEVCPNRNQREGNHVNHLLLSSGLHRARLFRRPDTSMVVIARPAA